MLGFRKKEFSLFMFRNFLIDYIDKNLDPSSTKAMKNFVEENSEAKNELGSALLSLEYLEGLSQIQIVESSLKSSEDLNKSSKPKFLKYCILLISFSALLSSAAYFYYKFFYEV